MQLEVFLAGNRMVTQTFNLMLHGTIGNDDFYRNTALQCWNNVVAIRNNVARMLQRRVAQKIVVANRLVFKRDDSLKC